MSVPNAPLRRMWNFVIDPAFPTARWLKQPVYAHKGLPPQAVRMAQVPSCASKEEDPDWRINRSWVLFRVPEYVARYGVWFSVTKSNNVPEVRMSLFTFTEQYFAMRTGADIVHVYLSPAAYYKDKLPPGFSVRDTMEMVSPIPVGSYLYEQEVYSFDDVQCLARRRGWKIRWL